MTTWHAPPAVLARFATEPGALDEVTASSVEQHLLGCGTCRAAVASMSPAAWLGDSWAAVADRIDEPVPSPAERLLHRLGVPDDQARLVAATPGLRLSWFTAVAVLAAAAATVATRSGDSHGLFLAVAPLVPLAAVLVSFLPPAEPAGEAGVATPLHGAGLVLRRAVAVLVPTTLLAAGIGLVLAPDTGLEAVAWVLPGLALALTALALGTVVRVGPAAAGIAGAWCVAVFVATRAGGRMGGFADTLPFSPRGQAVALLVIALSAAVLAARQDRIDSMGVQL